MICKSKVFMAEANHFRTKRGAGFSVRLNLQKRLSCPGCDNCEWIDFALGEIDNDWHIQGIENAESHRYYVLAYSEDEPPTILQAFEFAPGDYRPKCASPYTCRYFDESKPFHCSLPYLPTPWWNCPRWEYMENPNEKSE